MNPNQQNMWPGVTPTARPAMPPRQPMPPVRPMMARPAPRPMAPAQPMQPAQPAQTVSPVNPERLESLADEMQAALNENAEAEKTTDVVFKDASKKSKNTGIVLGMVLLALVAVAGIGFGVYTMYDSNKQIESLNTQIAALKATNDSLAEQLANTSMDDAVDEEETDIDDGISASYIDVTDWGLKILIPDTLKDASFVLLNDGNELSIKGWVGEAEVAPSFVDLAEGLGTVKRYAVGTYVASEGSTDELIFADDAYEYYYSAPQTTYATEEAELAIEQASVEAIRQMLINAENYTKE